MYRNTLRKICAFIFVLISLHLQSTVCTALMNGNWNNPSVWSCNAVPGCCDTIVIPSGITVTVNVQVDLESCSCPNPIHIYGTLFFKAGQKMRLPCGSYINIYPGGKIEPETASGSNNLIEICNKTVWKASDGTLTGPVALDLIHFDSRISYNDLNDNLDLICHVELNKPEQLTLIIEHSQDGEMFENVYQFTSYFDYNNKFIVPIDKIFTGDNYYKISLINEYGKELAQQIHFYRSFNSKWQLYPNPFVDPGQLKLRIPNEFLSYKGVFSVFDMQGKLLLQSEKNIEQNNYSMKDIFPYGINKETFNSSVIFIVDVPEKNFKQSFVLVK
ncbi:MAG: hypothetical protein KatS3mg034_2067 [Vicingaceae bacterium]|nr:MAG: hypothetical protein KatS3mg034_2067 [Vicingaceae bacterium]